ncbi:MAG: hypothetical protein VYD64_06470 [Pseudomonadota bacterium]|nr:hypothetical protein [Pseudomonadota bacterium]
MFEIGREFAFARMRLAIDCPGHPVVTADAASVSPRLPEGMRVDRCQLDALMFQAEAKVGFTIILQAHPNAGWEADYESGESLDAIVYSDAFGSVGSIAMRDPDWMCRRYDLECVDASQHTTPAGELIATYRSRARVEITIQASCAWIQKSTTEQEANSPWFAVDKALIF